jgi:hypothetical protein
MSPELVDRGGFAHDAVVQHLAARLELLADHHRAVDRRAFLVAGDQEGDGQGRVGMGRQEFLDRHHHGRDRGFHVGGAAPVHLSVAMAGRERVAEPLVERAGGHDVGVAGEHQGLCVCRFCRSTGLLEADALGPEVGDAKALGAADDGFALKPSGASRAISRGLAVGVVGRDGGAGDQLFGEVQGSGHGRSVAFESARRSERRRVFSVSRPA